MFAQQASNLWAPVAQSVPTWCKAGGHRPTFTWGINPLCRRKPFTVGIYLPQMGWTIILMNNYSLPRSPSRYSLVAVFATLCTVAFAAKFTFITLAGRPGGSPELVDGPAEGARFSAPHGLVVDANRNVYVADTQNPAIRKITPAGIVSTIAGGRGRWGSADGPGATASFNSPWGIAIDQQGNLYIADTYNYKIRKIDATGYVSTLAGTGTRGSLDGAAFSAQFSEPSSLALDGAGNIYVCDMANHTIRRIATDGMVATIAGVAGVPGYADGSGANARFNRPVGLAIDSLGNIYVADTQNHCIRKLILSSSGYIVKTLAGSTAFGYSDGVMSNARFYHPEGIAVDGRGNIYVGEAGNNSIRLVTPGGSVSSIGGYLNPGSSDGTGSSASFNTPRGLAVTTDGDLYVADCLNSTIRYASNADSEANYNRLTLPIPGEHIMNALTRGVIELKRINTKQPDPNPVDSWNFVDASGNLILQPSDFTVMFGNTAFQVTAVGFKRHPLYAPERLQSGVRDLRIENCIYLKLAQDIAWGLGTPFPLKVSSSRFPEIFTGLPSGLETVFPGFPPIANPVIHVNQEGYAPALSKKAYVGYYLGSLGELTIPSGTSFSVYPTNNFSSPAFTGTLVARPDQSWGASYGSPPYQQVWEADFTGLSMPGEYRLWVPNIGFSFPFLINDGIPMQFLRTIATGIYHQRCGAAIGPPYSRYSHAPCHTAVAAVPWPRENFEDAWRILAEYNSELGSGPLKYSFINSGPINTAGGHHDAGDYSKYTTNVALLVNQLMFSVDSVSGAAALDNLGIPESGDGISDIIQMAKWEADFLAKLQDADGGFYFLVYPRTRQYEGDVTPENGDSQIVWPKNTSATAAAIAALAQCASSPLFKTRYPSEAANYRTKALLGWQFLLNAESSYPGNAYQRFTHYGDAFQDRDEIAWAACELFLLTGEEQYHQQLKSRFPNPRDRATYQYGWDAWFEGYGNTARSYAFAVRSNRLPANQLTASYLALCESRLVDPPQGESYYGTPFTWFQENAYGTSLPYAAKQGWWNGFSHYHSLDRVSPIAASYALAPSADKLAALVGNLNYEAGANPVNMSFISGVGIRRQREVVNQWTNNDARFLPFPGQTTANIVHWPSPLQHYGNPPSSELVNLAFPSGSWTTTIPTRYPVYDRWADTWNVNAEFVVARQASALVSLCVLANQTSAVSQPWTSGTAKIMGQDFLGYTALFRPLRFTFTSSQVDSSTARIVWEGRTGEPAFGVSYEYVPTVVGQHWVEVEATAPDGRRVSDRITFGVN